MAALFIVTLPLMTISFFFFKQKLKALGLHSQNLNDFLTVKSNFF